MLSQEVEGALIHLYRAEMRLRRLLDERAPDQIVEQTKKRLHQRWAEARKIGITEELMSRFGWSLYVEDVSVSLEHRFRDECACREEFLAACGPDSLYHPHETCKHAQTSDNCSPFCPHFRSINQHSDLSGLAGQH